MVYQSLAQKTGILIKKHAVPLQSIPAQSWGPRALPFKCSAAFGAGGAGGCECGCALGREVLRTGKAATPNILDKTSCRPYMLTRMKPLSNPYSLPMKKNHPPPLPRPDKFGIWNPGGFGVR